MWVLLMIVFNQPYVVDHINNLGEYPSKKYCSKERDKAVKIINRGTYGPVSFGCARVKFTKNFNGRKQ
mgnify:FL=1|jgi:hypothetical protein